jgi:hypothetical protein
MRSFLLGIRICGMFLCAGFAHCLLAAETGISFDIKEPGKIPYTLSITAIACAPDAAPDEKKAASELSNYLNAMTGTKIPVRELQPLDSGKNALLVGKPAMEKGLFPKETLAWCGPEGYVVAVKNDSIGIAGNTPKGTLSGAYHLLEDLGCRFFTPDCEIVPKSASLSLPYASKRDRPFFDLRTTGTIKQGGDYFYNVVSEPLRAVKEEEQKYYPRLWTDHTQGFLVPVYKYFKTHPEYYGHDDAGKTFVDVTPLGDEVVSNRTDQVWVCMSNPEVRKIAAATLLDWIGKQPAQRFFTVMGGDSGTNCVCSTCKEKGNLSENLVAFANYLGEQVEKQYPDKLLLIFAYGETLVPPTKERPRKNVVVLFAPIQPRSGMHSFLSSPYNANFRPSFDKWYQIAPENMGTYDYNMGGDVWPVLDKMIIQLKEYGQRNMRGVWYCGDTSMMQALFTYVNAKLLWDPLQDDNVLIKEFCDGYYGAAGPAMTQFVKLKRAQVHADGVLYPPYPMNQTGLGRPFYSKEFNQSAVELFTQAEEAVKGNDVLTRRVQAIYGTILAGVLNMQRGIDRAITAGDRAEFARRLAKYLELKIGDGKGKLPEQADFIWRVAHLRVKEPWASDPVIARFLEDPMATLEKEQVRWEELQQEIPGGWEITLDAFTGYVGPIWWNWGMNGPRRKSLWIYPKPQTYLEVPYNTMDARLFLKETPKEQYQLELEGTCHLTTPIRININGKVLFEGKNELKKEKPGDWGTQSVPIPADTLRKGKNVIKIEHLGGSDYFALSGCKVLAQGRK